MNSSTPTLGSKSICLYGASDSGKTANAGRFARYIYEKTGKLTRAVLADLGGGADVLKPYIEAGVIEPWYIAGLPEITGVLHKLARGAWPVAGTDGKLHMEEASEATWRRVGGYIVDSGTGCVEQILESVRSKGVKLSANPSFTYTEEGETMYGGNESYYGFAQQEFERILRKWCLLPVERVLWTMGEHKGEDELTQQTVYGPETVGKALRVTGKLPKKFGDLYHLEHYSVVTAALDPLLQKPQSAVVRRIYFVSHPDPKTGNVYPAKPRLPPELWPELLQRWPGGYLTPTIQNGTMVDALDDLLRAEDQLIAQSVGSVSAWKDAVDSSKQPRGPRAE